MKNCPEPPEKCKKKIAELLEQALKESDDFAAKYAPIKRNIQKSAQKENSPENHDAPKAEVKFFDDTSCEFANAMRKIPPELLRLLKDQFQAAPSTLLSGVFDNKTETSIKSEDVNPDEMPAEDFYEED